MQKLSKRTGLLLLALGCMSLLSACGSRLGQCATADTEVNECRMLYLLDGSSPRNLNGHPKVTQEWQACLPNRNPCPKEDCESND